MAYDYREQMKSDVLEYGITEEIKKQIMNADDDDLDSIKMELHDDFWIDDSITGNACGSYWCNSSKAKECVIDNLDLVADMADEFCVENAELGEHFRNKDWEYFDVSIRCYLLFEIVSEVVDSIKKGDNEQ